MDGTVGGVPVDLSAAPKAATGVSLTRARVSAAATSGVFILLVLLIALNVALVVIVT